MGYAHRAASKTCSPLRNTDSAYGCARSQLASAGGWSFQAQCALETSFEPAKPRLAKPTSIAAQVGISGIAASVRGV
jgi:hypothetical protein